MPRLASCSPSRLRQQELVGKEDLLLFKRIERARELTSTFMSRDEGLFFFALGAGGGGGVASDFEVKRSFHDCFRAGCTLISGSFGTCCDILGGQWTNSMCHLPFLRVDAEEARSGILEPARSRRSRRHGQGRRVCVGPFSIIYLGYSLKGSQKGSHFGVHVPKAWRLPMALCLSPGFPRFPERLPDSLVPLPFVLITLQWICFFEAGGRGEFPILT